MDIVPILKYMKYMQNNINGDDNMKQEFKPKEFAKLIRKDKTTLLRWHKEGKLIPYRIEGNNRYYSLQQLKDIRGEAFYEREIMDREELLGLIDELEKRIYFLETNYKKVMEEQDLEELDREWENNY